MIRILSVLTCALWPLLSSAHEFWIAPERWQYAPGDQIVAHLRNGEMFEGISLAWFDRSVARAELVLNNATYSYSGRLGDRPALTITAPEAGLGVILHETTASNITYKTWEKFQAFLDEKGLDITRADHLAAGHPEAGFREVYTRHTKALVAVGEGLGVDRDFGLETEFISMSNPYEEKFNLVFEARLLYQGAPRRNAQVDLFSQNAGGDVRQTVLRSDEDGRVVFNVTPGHSYLLDAVVLRPSADEAAVYETLWAGLSFHVPANVPD